MLIMCLCTVAQLCPSLWDPMNCNPPGFSVHKIYQARILEWVAISFSRGSSQSRDGSCISCIVRWEALFALISNTKFRPTNHMTNSELKRKTLSTYPCQMPKHCWIVSHLSVQGHIEVPHSSLHGPYTTICSPRLCCHHGNPSRLIWCKSLCPLVLQLPIGTFQLPRTLTQNERLRIIPASVLLTSPLSLLLPPIPRIIFLSWVGVVLYCHSHNSSKHYLCPDML